MIIIKFIVLFRCFSVMSSFQNNFCEICSNHTLCKYKEPGPSPHCKSYDDTALLSTRKIIELVHKINERRNFVSLGQSRILPPAANMKKINWSTELANIAQRWANQCDPSMYPDKEDYCRDLENTRVGQNIASVAGLTSGLNVKNFVDMWFIQVLEYTGTVTFYNQSQDASTRYFTQLIWAETDYVGCGKSKFYNERRKVTLERLVCNFAPKGNEHGKPVYAVGQSGTQCPDNMTPDEVYNGLCSSDPIRKSTTPRSQSSLLRILNLSNNSVKHEIDPVHNNLKQTNFKRNQLREQKISHVLTNTREDPTRRRSLRKQYRKSLIHNNMTRSLNHHEHVNHHPERGHSRLYHGYEQTTAYEPFHSTPSRNYFLGNYQDQRKYDTSPPIYLISSPNYRKPQHNEQCTRKTGQQLQLQCSCCINCKHQNQCTRGQNYDCHESTSLPIETFTNPTLTDEFCPCSTTRLITCPPILAKSANDECYCDTHKTANNMIRSGNHKSLQRLLTLNKYAEQYYEPKLGKKYDMIVNKNKNDGAEDNIDHAKFQNRYHLNLPDPNYHHPLDTDLRKKRQFEEEITLKPFWKMNELVYKKSPDPNMLRYTTLFNRNNRKTKINIPYTRSIITEPITIIKEDYSNDNDDEDHTYTKGKYLSFDELMLLRKLNDENNLRRQGGKEKKKGKVNQTTKSTKATTKGTTEKKDTTKTTSKATKTTSKVATTKSTTKTTIKAATTPTAKPTTKPTTKSTTKPTTKPTTQPTTQPTTKVSMKNIQETTKSTTEEYTANTTFKRKKHCTRKLTCTWTAYTGTAEGANVPNDFGSRTPPGYVEGCTRTSTCTRDFMDRNVMALKSTTRKRGSGVVQDGGHDDGDYCEK